MDYSFLSQIPGALAKPAPKVIARAKKQKAEKRAWKQTAKAVDTRDAVDESPVCFVTGKRLQTSNSLDEWTFRDRAHLRARSKEKQERFNPANVFSCSRSVHVLFDRHAFWLLDRRGRPARSIATIDHFAWNRNLVSKGDEVFHVRKGLAVRETEK